MYPGSPPVVDKMTLHESLMVAPALVACGVLMVVMYAKQRQFQRPIEAVHTDKAPAGRFMLKILCMAMSI